MQRDPGGFRKFAWAVLAYTVFVILFGAWVRITGSGAGCGQHWPTCKGEVVHFPDSVETVIELTHRLTSGLDLLAVVALLIAAFVRFEKGSWVRRGAVLSFVFIITEALLGASLVLLRLVGSNDSIPRALMMALHLTNTSLLTGAMAIVIWAANGRSLRLRWRAPEGWWLVGALVATVVVSGVGAVTALGDTLYPVSDSANAIAAGLAMEPGVSVHFLERVRIVHPAIAVGLGLALFYLSSAVRETRPNATVIRWSWVLTALVAIQLGAGVLNIALSAPGWMQIVHLFFAVALWIALVFVTLGALEDDAAATRH